MLNSNQNFFLSFITWIKDCKHKRLVKILKQVCNFCKTKCNFETVINMSLIELNMVCISLNLKKSGRGWGHYLTCSAGLQDL